MTTALITGATAGIGAAFARRLAGDGARLVLVARDEKRLAGVAAELTDRHGVPDDGPHEVLAADLTVDAERKAVEDRLRDRADPVDTLVSNAGVGLPGRFWDADPDGIEAQTVLGVTVVQRLMRAGLEGMVERGQGTVLNVASFAALLPGRNGAAYTAAKAYTVSLTSEVAADLAAEGITGVRVLAVCPGWTRTELHARSGSDSPEASSSWWLDADQVVEQALADRDRGRTRSVPGDALQGAPRRRRRPAPRVHAPLRGPYSPRWRAIRIFWTSLVPSPISRIFESR
ncbi:dehydrogenase [Actinomycetospora sp. NBRC 106375]|uniref:SDR family NAD(P)-dependent oxidoreductase n=1 Tax=Actinomycetospora sp. NBRC 106375 TaxID=3032207 RepID=UPI0024A269B7|nr:SDR family NAD(P)-dependent oxidoreductase [Actinomycetospora sp. NBRC 106375]GLZ44875.1 dehydrogenase [Actinomycetospora sp. NBRC 106375]